MSTIQISAHGFDLTASLRECCEGETNERLIPIARSEFSVRWTLSKDGDEHCAKLHWNDGVYHGDMHHVAEDMYATIHHCAKKAAEQMKKTHTRVHEQPHMPTKAVIGDGE